LGSDQVAIQVTDRAGRARTQGVGDKYGGFGSNGALTSRSTGLGYGGMARAARDGKRPAASPRR
jgi:hypothetical protein